MLCKSASKPVSAPVRHAVESLTNGHTEARKCRLAGSLGESIQSGLALEKTHVISPTPGKGHPLARLPLYRTTEGRV